MLIRRLDIRNIRNLREVRLDELSNINLLYGLNGSGKTSVLESIYLLSLARTFRSHKLKPLINTDAETCVVFGEVDIPGLGFQGVGVERSKKAQGSIRVAGKTIKSSAQLAENLPVQVLNADTFNLLAGGPVIRRQFLDWGVFHVEPLFHKAWKTTQRCLKQRNSLLRHDRIDADQLAGWTTELIEIGEQIDGYRRAYFEAFLPVLLDTLSIILNLEGVELNYYCGWDKARGLAETLKANFARDGELGYTQSGPHRADIKIRYKGALAADILSRGQQKLLVCAMRIAQARVLVQKAGKRCVFLVDDLPSELDKERRKLLCGLLEELGSQVFITCVDAQDLAGCWSSEAEIKMFHVEHGQVSVNS
jgi:DNA replication and repair protein RecF